MLEGWQLSGFDLVHDTLDTVFGHHVRLGSGDTVTASNMLVQLLGAVIVTNDRKHLALRSQSSNSSCDSNVSSRSDDEDSFDGHVVMILGRCRISAGLRSIVVRISIYFI
jgi:hypothetical protein